MIKSIFIFLGQLLKIINRRQETAPERKKEKNHAKFKEEVAEGSKKSLISASDKFNKLLRKISNPKG